MRANRVLRRLVRWNVIESAGELQRLPDRARGTKAYREPLLAAELLDVEVRKIGALTVEAVEVDPLVEVTDEPSVNRAIPAFREDLRVITAGHGALTVDRPAAVSSGALLNTGAAFGIAHVAKYNGATRRIGSRLWTKTSMGASPPADEIAAMHRKAGQFAATRIAARWRLGAAAEELVTSFTIMWTHARDRRTRTQKNAVRDAASRGTG